MTRGRGQTRLIICIMAPVRTRKPTKANTPGIAANGANGHWAVASSALRIWGGLNIARQIPCAWTASPTVSPSALESRAGDNHRGLLSLFIYLFRNIGCVGCQGRHAALTSDINFSTSVLSNSDCFESSPEDESTWLAAAPASCDACVTPVIFFDTSDVPAAAS